MRAELLAVASEDMGKYVSPPLGDLGGVAFLPLPGSERMGIDAFSPVQHHAVEVGT